MGLIPLATYSSISMINFLINSNFAEEDKTNETILQFKPFGYTFVGYFCSLCTNNRYLKLRKKGEARIERVLSVETLLWQSKMVRLMAKMMFKSKFEKLLAEV